MSFTATDGVWQSIVASVVIVIGAVIIRLVMGRLIRRDSWSSAEDARRWTVRVRNLTLILMLLGLVIVWAEQLRAAAFSLVAFAVAAVIAGRETIMAVSGSFTRAISGSFIVGDRVRIGSHRGYVIDHSMLSTTLLEIGPGHIRTGRTLVLPNSLLLTEAIANETRGHEYILHAFTVPVKQEQWRLAHETLLAAATTSSIAYIDEARRSMEESAREYSLSIPIVDPFVLAKPTAPDTVELTVRVPVPARDAWRIEHEVLQAWLQTAALQATTSDEAGEEPSTEVSPPPVPPPGEAHE